MEKKKEINWKKIGKLIIRDIRENGGEIFESIDTSDENGEFDDEANEAMFKEIYKRISLAFKENKS